MSTYDVILRAGTLVEGRGTRQANLAVSDGKIAAIEPDLEGTAGEEIDVGGLHVLPGAIDAHAHFNEPGRAHWEGFATGSQSLDEMYTLRRQDLLYRHKVSPYIGRAFHSKVVRTILRGITVCREGRITSEPVGKLVKPDRRTAGVASGTKTYETETQGA